MDAPLWWHVYSGIMNDVVWGDNLHCLYIIGGSTMAPEEMRKQLKVMPDMIYRGSFDHDPTDAERTALTPEEYLDE